MAAGSVCLVVTLKKEEEVAITVVVVPQRMRLLMEGSKKDKEHRQK